MKELIEGINFQNKPKGLTRQSPEGYSIHMPQFAQGRDNLMPENSVEIITKKAGPHMDNNRTSPAGGLKELFRRRGLNVSNVDSARVIELMENVGVRPEDIGETLTNESSKTFSTEKIREVMKNSSLEDQQRIEKAAQILKKRNLTENEREALLSAHNLGQGEVGKNGSTAGVYNYTEGQLLRKVRILNKAGFTSEEIRTLMEAGLVGAPVDNSGISDPAIAAEMEAMNNALEVELQPSLNILSEALNNISRLTVNPAEKQIAIDRIKQRLNKEREVVGKTQAREQEYRDVTYRFGLSLMKEEMDALMTTPMEWLNGQFDHVYSLAEEGQELNSPLIQNTQNKISYAIDLINASNPEHLKGFIAESTVRLHLLQMRTAIGYKDMDQVKGAAGQLRAHGLLLGMKLEDGKVGAMFNRFQDKLEETRLWSNTRHHVMLEDVLTVQKTLINEQMTLAENGKGSFGDLSNIVKHPEYQADLMSATKDEAMTDLKIKKDEKEITEALKSGKLTDAEKTDLNTKLEKLKRIKDIKKVHADITRIMRTAYDVFVSSQRMGVVVSRGKYLLKGSNRYRSDPIGPLNAYNMEDLTIDRFDQYSSEQEEFVARIKLDMADNYLKQMDKKGIKMPENWKDLSRQQKIDLGKRLFRDLFAVPDYFSSGWRIEAVIQALEQRFESSYLENDKVPDDVLKKLGPEEVKGKSKRQIAKLAAKKKAEDFALFMRLRFIGQDQYVKEDDVKKREEILGKIKTYRPEEIIRLFRERDNKKVAGFEKNNVKVNSLYDEMISLDNDLLLTPEEVSANLSEDGGGRGRDLTVYDKFKRKYGAVIGLLRQEGYDYKENGNWSPIQINFSELNDPSSNNEVTALRNKQKETINKFLGDDKGAEKLMKLTEAMQKFIDKNALIKDLISDNKFADIYTRSIIIDDALLDKIEDEKPDTSDKSGVLGVGYVPFSKMVGESGAGNDTYTRSWNDTDNAIKAGNTLIEFVKEENLEKKTEAALKFASLASAYNGLGAKGQAECVRYTIGTYLNLAKLYNAWDIVGLESLPFRIPASEAQKIFGVQADAKSRDELRVQLDHLRGFLATSMSKKREEMNEKIREIGEKGVLSPKQSEDVKKYLPKDYAEKAKLRNMSESDYIKSEYGDGIKNIYIQGLKYDLEKEEEESQGFYKDLEAKLQTRTIDYLGRTGARFLLFLMLWVIGETYKSAETAAKDFAKK
jgi:hypothetical protein